MCCSGGLLFAKPWSLGRLLPDCPVCCANMMTCSTFQCLDRRTSSGRSCSPATRAPTASGTSSCSRSWAAGCMCSSRPPTGSRKGCTHGRARAGSQATWARVSGNRIQTQNECPAAVLLWRRNLKAGKGLDGKWRRRRCLRSAAGIIHSPAAAAAHYVLRTVQSTMCWVCTAGLAVAKGHVPYALFMLLDVLRAFPGQVRKHSLTSLRGRPRNFNYSHITPEALTYFIQQIAFSRRTMANLRTCNFWQSLQVPDVSAVIHTSDFPCIKEHRNVPDTEYRDKKQEVGSRLECDLSIRGRCEQGACVPQHGSSLETDLDNVKITCSCSCRRSTTMATRFPYSATIARRASWISCSPTSRTLGTSIARSQVRYNYRIGGDRHGQLCTMRRLLCVPVHRSGWQPPLQGPNTPCQRMFRTEADSSVSI